MGGSTEEVRGLQKRPRLEAGLLTASWAHSSANYRISMNSLFNVAGVSGKPGGWEGLRKKARALENDIDLKLVSYSKLGTSLGRNKGPEV